VQGRDRAGASTQGSPFSVMAPLIISRIRAGHWVLLRGAEKDTSGSQIVRSGWELENLRGD
jgi:hypothetical protein